MQNNPCFQLLLPAISEQALDPAAALEFVADADFGATTLFLGRVRALNLGRAVSGISYSLFAPLVLRVFERACCDAAAAFGPQLRLHVSHSHGQLQLVHEGVVVAAGAPHRDQAFRACRKIIEIVKHQAPIWKKEHYADGDSEWSEGCALCSPATPSALSTAQAATQTTAATTTPLARAADTHGDGL